MVQHLLQSLLQRSDIGQSRTSALNPLQWLMVILSGGLVAALIVKASMWVLIVLIALVVSGCIFLLCCYWYFMKNNPDALRSEKFLFSKMALERGLIGDSLVGLFQEPAAAPAVALAPTPGIKQLTTKENEK
jgi:hypothetical protein